MSNEGCSAIHKHTHKDRQNAIRNNINAHEAMRHESICYQRENKTLTYNQHDIARTGQIIATELLEIEQ